MRGVAVAVLAVWIAVVPLAAQRPASLDRVDSLVTDGRSEEARSVLMAWWDGSRAPARADLQHALWLRAVLTVDPAQAAVDYQRLVVEYPGGAYSDLALLRLAQKAEARGDAAKERTHLRALVRDYPASPAGLDAARMLAAMPAPEPAPGPPPESKPPESKPPAPPPAPPEPPVVTKAQPPTAPKSPPAAGAWTVQLGAFASRDRARAFAARVAKDGTETRLVLVPANALIRVRAGRFESQAGADRLGATLKERGLEATVAGDANQEKPAP